MKEKDFFIVGIGASAGGLDAIQQLFDNIPVNTGMAFVIVQHLSPNFKSLMPELLAKHTNMKIFTAEDKQTIEPNCVYLNQKNKNLYIKGNKLFQAEKAPRTVLNLPIDIFFHTLGEEYKDKSIGIILSGTGSDGSRGIKTIKEAGGILFVQDPESAQFDGMPNSSIATSLIDFILSPEKIAETLIKIPNHQISLIDENEDMKSNEVLYFKILDLVHKYASIDFKQYKKNTLLRRLEKRMNINNFEKLYDYYVYLKSNPKEVRALKQDFLIGVTSFFRDVEAFELLKTKVLPDICSKKHKNEETIRVWVSGCSTGEEVYSIAMLLDEHIKQERLNVDFKIFATDIDEVALEKAGLAIYSHNAISEISREYAETYFIKESGNLKVIKRIRERIVFSSHNLLKDPPFIRMDLISCRNLLIYLESSIQKKVIMNFQFSLNQNGYLLLGNSESLGHQARFFKPLSSKWKIYQCIVDTKRLPMNDVPEERISTLTFKNTTPATRPSFKYQFKENPENAFYKYMGQQFSPAMVFTDTDFNILFVNGNITTRLSVNQGVFQSNLLKLVSKEMATVIRSGIRKAEKEEADVIITDVVNTIGKESYCFDLGFHISDNFEGLNTVYIIHFSSDKKVNSEKIITIQNSVTDEISKQRVAELEDELKDNKSQLQHMVEQLETSNEELQSSNEELMASNEELQSTNEELQSVNEELYTVNSELQEKNKELSHLNNDVNNLLNSTDIGTLFLDVNLRIRKFTPALQKHFNLQQEDVGRSIASFASNFKEDDRKTMIDDCKKVLEDLLVSEAEVCDETKACFLRRISPFITADKKIDGLIITFVNISYRLQIENKLKESEKRFKSVFNNAGLGIATISNKGEILSANPELEKILGYTLEELTEMRFQEFTHLDDLKNDLEQYQKLMNGEIESYKLDKRYIHKDGHIVWGQLTVTTAKDKQNKILYSIALLKDISESKMFEDALLKEKQFTERIAETSPNGIYIFDLTKGTNIYMNAQYQNILGYTMNEINALSSTAFFNLFHPDDQAAIAEHMEIMKKGEHLNVIEYRFKHKNGHWVWCYSVDTPFEIDEKGQVISFIGSFIDLSEKKYIEIQLKEAKQKAEVANIYKNQFLANMSHEIRTPMNGVVGFADLLDEDNLKPQTRKKYINIIKTSSNQLLNLINDIIDVSKIEANELKLEFKDCKLYDLLKSIETTFNEIKKQKGKDHIKIKCTIPSEFSKLSIKTDPLRLQQVLTNLIGNALKFTEEGTIEFGYSVPKKNFVSFFVKDQGIGIPKEKVEIIFNRFEQLESGNKFRNEGTGLGLAISKGIVTLLDGKFEVQSEKGKGTTFTFSIPYTEIIYVDQHQKNIVTDNTLPDGLKLLIADDEPVNIEYFKALFVGTTTTLLIAQNGLEAVELYKKNNDIDLILMDIRMPEMDGVNAAKEILNIAPQAKIIAQTAYAMASDQHKYLGLGFIDYISKPINKDLLLKKLNQISKK